jgi:hypothetical protein
MEAGAVLCHRGRVLVPARMNEAWRTFCRHGTSFIEHYECRGISFIGAANLSPGTKLVEGTGAAIAVQFVSEPESCHGTEF